MRYLSDITYLPSCSPPLLERYNDERDTWRIVAKMLQTPYFYADYEGFKKGVFSLRLADLYAQVRDKSTYSSA